MKYEKLIFIYPFPIGSFLNAKVGLEGTLEEGDDYLDCFHKIRKDVKLMADIEQGNVYDSPKLNITYDEPPQYKNSQSSTHEERRIGDIENDIKSCTDVRVLETYRLLVQTKPEFKAIYDEMHKKLSNLKKIKQCKT